MLSATCSEIPSRAGLRHPLNLFPCLLQAKREAQRRKEAAWRAQVATLRERVDHAQNDNAELRCHVAEQPYTAEEAARMNADKYDLTCPEAKEPGDVALSN